MDSVGDKEDVFEFEFQVDKQLRDNQDNDYGENIALGDGAKSGMSKPTMEGVDCVKCDVCDRIGLDVAMCERMLSTSPVKGADHGQSPLRVALEGMLSTSRVASCARGVANDSGSVMGEPSLAAGEPILNHVLHDGAHEVGAVLEHNGPCEESLNGPTLCSLRTQRRSVVRVESEQHKELLCEEGNNLEQPGTEGGIAGVIVKNNIPGEDDAQEGDPWDCSKENESEIAKALCSLNEDVLCDVPILQAHAIDVFPTEMKEANSCRQDGRAKRRRGRPRKQVLQSSKVSDSNIQLAQTMLALDQGPSEIAD
ncbi:methyl-accepting chemotaxis sensory transducer [Sesbania bispinosa]|nr:methyl-accepting chemotaxis sensory transducer [Sesbania bispinosa]